MILWFVIRNMYIWSSYTVFDTELLKPLEFQKWYEWKGVFCYVKDVTSEAPKAEGWLPEKPVKSATWLEGWKFKCRSLTNPHPPEEGRWRRSNQETSIDIYTLLCVRQIMVTCYITQGAQLGALWWPRGGCGVVGWRSKGRGDVGMLIADSRCCIAETNTAL